MLVLACLGGCTTGHYVVEPWTRTGTLPHVETELAHGDWIKVMMASGETYYGEFIRVDATTLYMDIDPYNAVEMARLSRQDIVSLDKRTFHFGYTVLTTVIVTATVIATALYIALSNMGPIGK